MRFSVLISILFLACLLVPAPHTAAHQDREYFHHDGYVDDVIAQIDAFGNIAYTLTDWNHTPVALVDDDGDGELGEFASSVGDRYPLL